MFWSFGRVSHRRPDSEVRPRGSPPRAKNKTKKRGVTIASSPNGVLRNFVQEEHNHLGLDHQQRETTTMSSPPLSPKEVDSAFQQFCPELHHSKWATYPIQYDRWLNFQETWEKKPVFVASEEDKGPREDYVYCKHTPQGKGYCHVLTKVAYVNLYSRLMSQGPPGAGCGCFGGSSSSVDKAASADAFDTARRVVYARSRGSRPDDGAAWEQQIDHMEGSKLPGHGLRV